MRPPAHLALAILAIAGTARAQVANEDQRLVAPAPQVWDQFGRSIALDGDLCAIGAPGAFASGLVEAGAVHLFERSGASWLHAAELVAPFADAGDAFGSSVAASATRIAIGAPGDDTLAPGAGAVHVFESTGPGTWVATATLYPSNPQDFAAFGTRVALDGDRLIVGSPRADLFRGAVHVFEFDGAAQAWNETAELVAFDAQPFDSFGASIDLEGGRIVAGAPFDSHSGGARPGSAYVFAWSSTANDWVLDDKLVHPLPRVDDGFGTAVALAGERTYVGVPHRERGGVDDLGEVIVFEDTTNGYAFVAEIESPDETGVQHFGSALRISGSRVLVGAPIDGQGTGAVHLFDRGDDGTHAPVQKLRGSELVVGAGLERFGAAVALDAGRIAVGSDPDTGLGRAGAVHAFDDAALLHGAPTVSLSGGGEQFLLIRAGDTFAGQVFVILGSGTGTSPGVVDPVTGIEVPLVADAYLTALLSTSGGAAVIPWYGLLDDRGHGTSRVAVPAGTLPSLAGVTLWHAAGIVDLVGTGLLSGSTNAVRVQFLP